MRYLIDTQILVWYQLNSRRLAEPIAEILLDTANEILVSQITLLEIVIKQKVGKLPELNVSLDDIIRIIREDGFEILNIENAHLGAYDNIPLYANHKDPFDRLILATAFFEDIPLISADEKFRNYQSVVHLIENI